MKRIKTDIKRKEKEVNKIKSMGKAAREHKGRLQNAEDEVVVLKMRLDDLVENIITEELKKLSDCTLHESEVDSITILEMDLMENGPVSKKLEDEITELKEKLAKLQNKKRIE